MDLGPDQDNASRCETDAQGADHQTPIALADHLDVSIDYPLARTDRPEHF